MQFKSAIVVFSEFRGSVAYGEAGMVGPINVKFDKTKKSAKVMLNFNQVMKGIEAHKEAQIIFELQAPDGGNLAGLGWTWVKIFTEAYPG